MTDEKTEQLKVYLQIMRVVMIGLGMCGVMLAIVTYFIAGNRLTALHTVMLVLTIVMCLFISASNWHRFIKHELHQSPDG